MNNSSRRSFLAKLAAAPLIPFPVWLENQAWAAGPLVRYEANTAKGQAMLTKYAAAVKRMKATSPRNPKSWVFQWYTHSVKGSSTKAAEIANIFGPGASPAKALAQAMWSTCQSHGGQPEDYFLPWHRMFVFFFESIVRSFSDPTFTLPYWNYSVSGANHGVVPKRFRMPGNATYGSLYEAKRNALANNGQPIDQGQPGSVLGLGSLAECRYSPQGATAGFCQALDFGLHGAVHVLVGNAQNMGSVPWAAEDAIFWMHHSNIDRLWASWNKAGRANNATTAGFLNKQFTFADASGNQVLATVKDFLALAPLKYTYDKFETVPPCPAAIRAGDEAVSSEERVSAESIELGAAPVTVTLGSAARSAAPAALGSQLGSLVTALKPDRRLYLVVGNLTAAAQPGVLFHLYLNMPSGMSPAQAREHYVGTIQFFDAVGHTDHTAEVGSEGPAKFFSFDITEQAKALGAKGLLNAEPKVTIAPVDQPSAEAKAVVGKISLVEQPA